MAFREDSTDTYTFPSNSTGSTVDLGARNTYRYINAVNVYNKGKADGVIKFTEVSYWQFEPGVGSYPSYINSSASETSDTFSNSKYIGSYTITQLSGYTYQSRIVTIKATCNVIQYIYIRGTANLGAPGYQLGYNEKNISAVNGTVIPVTPAYNNGFPTSCILLFY